MLMTIYNNAFLNYTDFDVPFPYFYQSIYYVFLFTTREMGALKEWCFFMFAFMYTSYVCAAIHL